MSQPRIAQPTAISGWVERVTHHHEESGHAILKVRTPAGLVTVTGRTPRVVAGERLEASGEWVNHAEYGRQFQAAEIRLAPPESLEGLERYLGSGLIDGIGPAYAKRIVRKFGMRVFEIIEHESARLEEVEGVGKKRRQEIRASWMRQKTVHEIMVYLHQRGISTGRAQRIYDTYREEAMEVLQKNPYRLVEDIRGVGFKTADDIAGRMGIAKNEPRRLRAGILHALDMAMAAGHVCLPAAMLGAEAQKWLEVGLEEIQVVLEGLLQVQELEEDMIDGTRVVYAPELLREEKLIAQRLQQLMEGTAGGYPAINVEAALDWCEKHTGRVLASGQREAVRAALQQRVLIITGGPGVGKTTIVNAILSILMAKEVKVVLAAPTGRAAQRLGAATGEEAKTLHRLLEFQGTHVWGRNRARPLQGDLFVVDEASMIDTPLMARFLEAVPDAAHLLVVGDADQLPSVGPGAVLKDMIASGRVPCVELTEVFRQAEQSRIVTAAHAINRGRMPPLKPQADGDFFFLEQHHVEEIQRTVVQLCCERLPAKYGFDPAQDIQVLCPMKVRELGARRFNGLLQQALNPPQEWKFEVERGGSVYRVGDKVIQTRNDYDKEVFNGDIGRITRIDSEPVKVTVRFEGGRSVEYEPGELEALQLAYAITIHKSQGSEFPCVVIPWSMAQFIMLERSLIYTAVTRGRKLVVIVGEEKALEMAVKKVNVWRRWSGLRERLRKA